MPTIHTFVMQGEKVVQIQTRTDDRGIIESESKIALGERGAALADIQEKLDEAITEHDGIAAAAPESPVAPSGAPGRLRDWYVRDGHAYEREVRRLRDGTPQIVRSRSLGLHGRALEHAGERVDELTAYRDGIRDAR